MVVEGEVRRRVWFVGRYYSMQHRRQCSVRYSTSVDIVLLPYVLPSPVLLLLVADRACERFSLPAGASDGSLDLNTSSKD